MSKLSNKSKAITILALITVAVIVVGLVSWFAVSRMNASETSPEATSSASTPEGWPTPTRSVAVADQPGDGTFVSAENVDRGSAEDVAEAFAMMSSSFDTVRDSNESGALERARPLMASELIESLTAPDRDTPWTEPRAHDAYTVPAATRMNNHVEDGHGPGESPAELTFPGTGEAIEPFTYRVSYQWQGRDDWVSETPEYRTVFLSLVEREGRWSVIEYGYRSMLS